MLVLGICDGHDAGACLVDDGRLIAAVSEERLTGKKRQAGFPYGSIECCLKLANVSPNNVDYVAVAERAGRSLIRILDRFYGRTNPNLPMMRASNILSMKLQNKIARSNKFSKIDAALSLKVLQNRLSRLGFIAPTVLVDHHLAHALSAAIGSGFDNALVITVDAFGDGCSGAVFRWNHGSLDELARIPYPHSPALLYGLVTSYLGFVEGDEGKVSAMAASGDFSDTKSRFDEMLTFERDRFRLKVVPSFKQLDSIFKGFAPEDIAAGLQRCVEDVVSKFVSYWIERVSAKRLCLAGGLFANVRLNQVVAQKALCDDVFVFYHMGDGGLCTGAAWAQSPNKNLFEIAPVFVGPEPGEIAEDKFISGNVKAKNLDASTAEDIALTIASKGIVGIIRGRLEFGPRALGNRSIIFSAQSKDLADKVSRALNRPNVMPFAPVVRDCDLDKATASPRWTALRHMTITVDSRPEIKEKFPVAVHTDGTMRIQVIQKEDNPLLYDILTAYGRYVTPAILINTSFNLHTEPIVAFAHRAFELFLKLPMVGLVLNNYYLEKTTWIT